MESDKGKSSEPKTVEDTSAESSSQANQGSRSGEGRQTRGRRVGEVAKKCEYCESTVTLHWRDEQMICNECILKYNIGRHVPAVPPEDEVKTCLHCGETSTPQWMNGPMGPNTLCNACGPIFNRPKRSTKYRSLHSLTYTRDRK